MWCILTAVPEEGLDDVLVGRLDQEVDKTLRRSAADVSPRIISKRSESQISGSGSSLTGSVGGS